MRTTVTLDADTNAIVRRLMREQGLTFKQAVNAAIRAGTTPRAGEPVQYTFPKDMGEPLFDVDKALQFTARLEDAEIVRKFELRK